MPPVTRAENPEEELSTDERHISLRVTVPAENGTAVIEMTGPAAPENGLQAFGDWVLAALEQHADGAAEAARRMIAALRERYWEGDDVLADQLDALLGSGAIPYLRPLPVDLDELPSTMRGRSGRRMRTNQTILTSGCGCTARVRATATGTWSCSSDGA
jgi:hypothetical protein